MCAQYDEKVSHLEWLLQSFADDQCVTGAEDLDHFVAVYGESPQGRPHEILVCLNLLLDPVEFGVDADSPQGKLPDAAEARQRNPLLLPQVPIATGPEREEARKRMKSLLMQEIEAWQAARDRDREYLLKSNAPYFRDSAIAKSKPESEVLLRRETSSFRQVGRLTDLLLKLKREARQAQNSPMNIKNEGTSHDVVDNKGPTFLSHDVAENKTT